MLMCWVIWLMENKLFWRWEKIKYDFFMLKMFWWTKFLETTQQLNLSNILKCDMVSWKKKSTNLIKVLDAFFSSIIAEKTQKLRFA